MRQSTMLATSFRRDIEIKLNALFDYVLKTKLSNVNERIFNQFIFFCHEYCVFASSIEIKT